MKQDPARPIESFKSYQRTKATAQAYQSGIYKFLDHIYGPQRTTLVNRRWARATPEEAEEYERLAVKYLGDATRNRGEDLISFTQEMSRAGVPGKTVHSRVNGTRAWFQHNDIELNTKETRILKKVTPRGSRTTGYGWFSQDMIREILAHLPARDRAFVLAIVSTGSRIHEMLALRWDDVKIPDRSKNPDGITAVYLRKTKTAIPRIAFLTREAEEALLQWRRVQPEYTAKVVARNGGLVAAGKSGKKDTGTGQVFNFRRTSAYREWDTATMAAGHYKRDPITGQAELSFKGLRSFFKSQAMAAGLPFEVSELLLGHSDQYGDAYTRQSPEALTQYFKKLEPFLTIASPRPLQEQTTRAIEGLEEENQVLRERLALVEEVIRKRDEARESDLYERIFARVSRNLATGTAKSP